MSSFLAPPFPKMLTKINLLKLHAISKLAHPNGLLFRIHIILSLGEQEFLRVVVFIATGKTTR